MLHPTEPSGRFVPEEFTHLYHTSCYAQLSEPQRLKYNQLFALRINEQFVQFEDVFIKRLMPGLERHPVLKNNPRILAAMASVLADEEQHSRMFARFNQGIRPDIYPQSCSYFTRLSTVEHTLLRMLLCTPGLLPGLVWLMLAMEELTTAISSELIAHSRSEVLDDAYIALHRRHFQDEKRHVGIDMSMIVTIEKHTRAPARKINAMLFRNGLQNILKPRRSTIQVVRHLAREEPGLEKLTKTMIDEIATLDPRAAFPANLVNAEKLPVLFGLFDRYPGYRL